MLSYRKFDKESDYNIMHRIVQHNCVKTGNLYPQLHVGNLDFERYAFEEIPDILYTTTWIVYDNNIQVGFITIQEDEFSITVLSEFEHFKQDILDYIEHICYTNGTTITTEANSEDDILSSILQERGYTKTEYIRFWYM